MFGVLHVPPHVGNGLPPEQVSRQKHAPPPIGVHVAFGSLQVPSHDEPVPPLQYGGTQNAGMPGAGPTQFQPGGQSPPQASTGGSDAHAQ